MGNSSVLALGNHPVGTGWKVSFDDQASTTKNHKTQSILLNNECLTTSGNNSDDRKHIISPSSGKPLEGVRQVTVVTDDGTTGETLNQPVRSKSKTARVNNERVSPQKSY